MKVYILFLFGQFDDHEDVEFFCEEVLTDIETLKQFTENNETNWQRTPRVQKQR